jgi:hypothetical protein
MSKCRREEKIIDRGSNVRVVYWTTRSRQHCTTFRYGTIHRYCMEAAFSVPVVFQNSEPESISTDEESTENNWDYLEENENLVACRVD